MRYMNEYQIEEACHRFAHHPVLGPATVTLSNMRDAVNQNSDGWPYWSKPVRAAKNLMELIQDGDRFDDDREDATPERLKVAYRPIKSFRTRTGIHFQIEEVA